MQPQSQSPPSESRWTATTADGRRSVTIVHGDDGWRFYDDTGVEQDPDLSEHSLVRDIVHASRHGWPKVWGWSLPRTGFDDPGIYLHLDALGYIVDGPRPSDLDAPTPTDGTIVG